MPDFKVFKGGKKQGDALKELKEAWPKEGINLKFDEVQNVLTPRVKQAIARAYVRGLIFGFVSGFAFGACTIRAIQFLVEAF